jgi:hypothetical protein
MHRKLFAVLLSVLLLLAGVMPAHAACTAANPNASVAESTPDSDFSVTTPVVGESVVTHSKTGLVWKQCPEGQSGVGCATGTATNMTEQNALKAAITADTANFAGHNDWRLPNVKELESIVETCGYNPSINQTQFPLTPASGFWSASTYVLAPTNAWAINFIYGNTDYFSKTSTNAVRAVRLVRGGQSLDSFDVLPVPVNAACVTGQTLTVAPSNPNLCTAGTAGSVTTNSTNYTWTCLGGNGGSDAPNCSAVRNYVVTSSVPGGNGAISASQNVAYNATPSFTLTPASGYVAGAVTGTCGGSLNANSFTTSTVTANCTVVASFTAAPVTTYLLSVSKTGTGTGTVTSDTGGINCGATCSASYASGATVTLAAAAASNSTFTGWSGACTGTASCVVSLSAARSVVAGFTAIPVPTASVASIPTLSEWTMILLATLMATLGLAALRRNPD